jgi:hypothetical protein
VKSRETDLNVALARTKRVGWTLTMSIDEERDATDACVDQSQHAVAQELRKMSRPVVRMRERR